MQPTNRYYLKGNKSQPDLVVQQEQTQEGMEEGGNGLQSPHTREERRVKEFNEVIKGIRSGQDRMNDLIKRMIQLQTSFLIQAIHGERVASIPTPD